jgi:hypothetical protein
MAVVVEEDTDMEDNIVEGEVIIDQGAKKNSRSWMSRGLALDILVRQ